LNYSRKPNQAEAEQRLDAFWAGSSLGRPAVHILALDPAHEPRPYEGNEPSRHEEDLNPARRAWNAVDCLDGGLFLAEAMPSVHVNIGSGLAFLPVLAGGKYAYDGAQAWIEADSDLLSKSLPCFDPANANVRKLDACFAAIREAIGVRGFVNPPMMLDPLTALSQMLGAEATAMGLISDRDRVVAWIDALTDLHVAAFRHYCELAGNAHSVVFYGPTTTGSAEALQCDFAVMLSPEMFGEFVMPTLQRIAAEMSQTLYHLDGVEQMGFLDQLQAIPNLKGIQWNPQTDYGKPSRHLAALKEIRRRGLVLHLFVDDVEEAVRVARELGPDGLFLRFRSVFETREKAEEALECVACAAHYADTQTCGK
jgi:hypothetical protein